MLSQFLFSNYKSFKSEAFLDFTAESIKDHEKSIIKDRTDGERFLPVLAIYGPNGGGKSTVLEALQYLSVLLLRPFIMSQLQNNTEYESIIKRGSEMKIREKYHKFDPECKDTPINFDIMFRTRGKQYKYQFSHVHNEIVEENLYRLILGEKDTDIIFERTANECVLGEELEEIPVEKIKSSMPLLSHVAINYDIEPVDEVMAWFMDIAFLDYDDPKKEKRIILPENKKERTKLFGMLQKMDINICDMREEKDTDGKVTGIYAKHILENGETYEIPYEEESGGTRKLFSCLAQIMECLKKGTLLIADELDAKLHPKLLQYIIELFTDTKSNRKGAQLLLTSHDITTMSPEVYRRDEIWFCALNPKNASKLYSLVSFKKENGLIPRSDEAYGKQYLEGRYGADPYIRKILNWEIENESEAIKSQRTKEKSGKD